MIDLSSERWEFEVDESFPNSAFVRFPGGCCEVSGSRFGRENRGRLIAAAPELLEALKGVLMVADRATDEFDAARSAIAKAEGEL